ncbi:hypothetical protein Leryth_001757 [Lithospermum erythrorhizon]|nr:hypothetical protein Leryth_001757 [Lithospermum erythrorhizon]
MVTIQIIDILYLRDEFQLRCLRISLIMLCQSSSSTNEKRNKNHSQGTSCDMPCNKMACCATVDSAEIETPVARRTSGNHIFPIAEGSSDNDVGDEEDELDNSNIIPSYAYSTISFQKRQALATYFENNKAGVTLYGFMLDRDRRASFGSNMVTADSSKTGEEFIRFLCIFLFYVSLYCLLVVADPVSLQHLSVFDGSVIGRFRFSSTAAPQPNEKETTKSGSEQGKGAENEGLNENAEESATARPSFREENESDSDLDLDLEDLSRDDLVKLVSEKEEILKMKHEEFQNMRIKGSARMNQSADTAGAGPLLKTLLEGVEMTDKQLAEKAGVEKFDPLNEQFDPNKHNAMFQVPNPSKPAGTVAAVLKAGCEESACDLRQCFRCRLRIAHFKRLRKRRAAYTEMVKRAAEVAGVGCIG